jgi:HAE1 family hydrophobic/amphiphilic exporter-1
VITSTFLTLLVIPSFYDSIETSRDRAVAKFRRRAQARPVALAFLQTLGEALLTLVFVRALFRGLLRLGRWLRRRGKPSGPALPA